MATFKACSLVCWAFVPASRNHVFRDIALDMVNDMPHKLHAILLQSPHLAMYVRDLTIYRSHDPKLWMKPGSPLPALLSMLPHVKRLSIFACWGDWLDVPPSLSAALVRLVSSGILDRLHLLTIANVPAALLQGALSVPVVSLFHVSPNPAEARLLHLPRDRPSPEYLNLSLDTKVGKILDRLQGSIHLSNVRRLAINPIPNSSNSAKNFARVLSAVENNLERLDVQWHECHFEQFHDSRFDLSRLKLLRTVQLHIIIEQANVTIPEYVPQALAELRETNPLLESLTYVFNLPNVAGKKIPLAGDVSWLLRLMDTKLGSVDDDSGFSKLREVHFKIVPECSPPNLVPDYAAFFQAHLPRTHSRGILSIEQGYRIRGAAVIPLLPYTSVWPHRPKKKQQ
ncbi:hypothetical protein B0H19DRAFT_1159127 [Mycena capillaripes]|nr:hypothetical protein B0H19DRAFT_1159127 [Mycena capillaripes]